MPSNTQRIKDHIEAAEMALILDNQASPSEAQQQIGIAIAHALIAIAIKMSSISPVPYS